MKTKLFLLLLFIAGLPMMGQEFKLVDNFIYQGKVYGIAISTAEATKTFKIKISLSENENAESADLVYDSSDKIVISTLKSLMSQTELVGPTFVLNKTLETRWTEIYNNKIKELIKSGPTAGFDNPDIEYSSEIILNKIPIPIRFDEKDNMHAIRKKIREEKKNKNEFSFLESICKKEIRDRKRTLAPRYKNRFSFVPEYASIRFFNNRVNKIAVVGKLLDKGKVVNKRYTITNNTYSVPFRYLIKKGSTLFLSIDDYDFLMEWDDLLDLVPIEESYSYAVKNKSYKLAPNQSVKVESRNLFDYFTGIVFTDFLGLNSNNNNLLNAEARAIIPLALVNKARWNTPEYFEIYLNTSIYNGQEETVSEVIWDGTADNRIPVFDFFKKRNIEAGINLGLLSFEWRNISSNFTLDYGVQFYRTKLHQQRAEDSMNPVLDESVQLYAIAHGPKLKIDMRPQVNFGADLNIGLLGYNFNGFNDKLTTTRITDNTTTPVTTEQIDFKHQVLDYKRTFYNTFYITTNLYTKLNAKESNGGLYFRLSTFYDLNTYSVSPQIMAGYATNLTTFINKFKKKNETTTTP